MLLVFDSSILCQDLRFTGIATRILFGNVRMVPVVVAVPEVVIDEVTNHFRERLGKAKQTLTDAHKKLVALVPESGVLLNPANVEIETAKYRDFLLQQFSEVQGRILPYPNISHQKIVKRDLQRRKPFKENGSGYRDLLIWESLRSLTWSGHERVAFITANTKDFIADARLHDDLAADILNPDRVEVFSSLKEFNEKHVIPRLETVDRFNEELRNISGNTSNVASWIRENLLEILRDEELGYAVSPVPDGPGSFWASEIVSFDDLKITSARRLEEDGLLCAVIVRASVDVSIDIDEEDYRNNYEVREYLGGPGSWNEVFALAISMELIVDAAGSGVSSYDVTQVETVSD
jgi:hypothetical protein